MKATPGALTTGEGAARQHGWSGVGDGEARGAAGDGAGASSAMFGSLNLSQGQWVG